MEKNSRSSSTSSTKERFYKLDDLTKVISPRMKIIAKETMQSIENKKLTNLGIIKKNNDSEAEDESEASVTISEERKIEIERKAKVRNFQIKKFFSDKKLFEQHGQKVQT